MAKRFRLQSRTDGSATYLAVTSEGSEVLTIGPDGSVSYSSIIGVCITCAFPRSLNDVCPEHPDRRRADGAEPVDQVAAIDEKVRQCELGEDCTDDYCQWDHPWDRVQNPIQLAHSAPVAEPTSEPAPEPVDDQLDRDARMVGKSVWFRSPQSRHELFQGLRQLEANARLERAVERGWVTVEGDRVLKGPVNPAPRMGDERSQFERMTAWGPGW